ncbi:hypothetical protein H5410_023978, partial [Solanum commersonii]
CWIPSRLFKTNRILSVRQQVKTIVSLSANCYSLLMKQADQWDDNWPWKPIRKTKAPVKANLLGNATQGKRFDGMLATSKELLEITIPLCIFWTIWLERNKTRLESQNNHISKIKDNCL